MSLKVVLPLATLVFGGSATVTTGVYFYSHGSGKGHDDKNHKFKKPDDKPAAPEKEEPQTKKPPAEVETPAADKGSSQVKKGPEDSGQQLDKSRSSQNEDTRERASEDPTNPNPGENKGQDQNTNPSGTAPEHSAPEKQSLEPKGAETPPTPKEPNQTEKPTDVTKQVEEQGVENPSQQPGGTPDLKPETEGGAGNEGGGDKDDRSDTSDTSTEETPSNQKNEGSSEEKSQVTENPSS